MAEITTPYVDYDIYTENNFGNLNFKDLNNKLFCTFTKKEYVDDLLNTLTSKYTIMYNKIFVLQSNNGEYVCTYNVDNGNINDLPGNTILVHRKKESNTLYTINALNELIKQLNYGIVTGKQIGRAHV